MTDLVLKLIVLVGVVLLIAVGVTKCRSDQNALRDRTAQLEQAERTATATTGIVSDIRDNQAETHRVEVVVDDARSTYQRGYENARRTDPSIDDWAVTDIPLRVRELARERRLQRERLGCIGDGCRSDDPAQRNRVEEP